MHEHEPTGNNSGTATNERTKNNRGIVITGHNNHVGGQMPAWMAALGLFIGFCSLVVTVAGLWIAATK